ncbi:MAG: antibiotic biosynthesis monooxygenase, partial [Acidobacteriota bacterium]
VRPRAALPTPAGVVAARGRLAFATWLGVYPVLTLIAWLFEPVLAGRPVALRTLVMSALMVPIMVYFVMPWIRRHL